ncbi:MAG: hypothetical protein DRJ40_09635 [Thermoprotei archaeon]|nr:MAG: hypothetical protein DRJ40_09635 [Thermoprotei archaeon]
MLLYLVHGVLARDYTRPRGFTGFATRGMIGSALRSVCCVTGSRNCSGCCMRGRCIYYHFFESRSCDYDVDFAKRGARAGVSRPYSVEPAIIRGREIVFGFYLLAPRYLIELRCEPVIILSLLKCGMLGLGMDARYGERRRFFISRILRIDPFTGSVQVVYRDDAGIIREPIPTTVLSDDLLRRVEKKAIALRELRPRYIVLNFTTPTMVVHNRQVVTEPPLHAIVMNLARRYSQLAAFHRVGQVLSVLEARELRDAVRANAKLVYAHRSKVVLRKYMIASDERRVLGTFIRGYFVYEVQQSFWRKSISMLALQLLILGQYMGVGQLAAAGCGKYVLTLPVSEPHISYVVRCE